MAGTHITDSSRVGEMNSFVSPMSFFIIGAALVIDGGMPVAIGSMGSRRAVRERTHTNEASWQDRNHHRRKREQPLGQTFGTLRQSSTRPASAREFTLKKEFQLLRTGRSTHRAEQIHSLSLTSGHRAGCGNSAQAFHTARNITKHHSGAGMHHGMAHSSMSASENCRKSRNARPGITSS